MHVRRGESPQGNPVEGRDMGRFVAGSKRPDALDGLCREYSIDRLILASDSEAFERVRWRQLTDGRGYPFSTATDDVVLLAKLV